MKSLIRKILFGRDQFSFVIALGIVCLVALGCTCAKTLSDLDKADNSQTPSNTSPGPAPVDKPVQKADASTGRVPSDDQLQDLVKTTVLDFNDAVQKGDFSDFHRNISKTFQKEASPEKFKTAFKSFTDAGIDLSEVESLTANFTSPAAIDNSLGTKMLKLKGNFATSPRRANFDLKYIPEGREWKLIYIEINTRN